MIQVSETGYQVDDGPIVWGCEPSPNSPAVGAREHEVPASHRRRILDREADRGVHPGSDGWLVMCHWDDRVYGRRVRNYTRLRWLDDLEARCR